MVAVTDGAEGCSDSTILFTLLERRPFGSTLICRVLCHSVNPASPHNLVLGRDVRLGSSATFANGSEKGDNQGLHSERACVARSLRSAKPLPAR
ncbi:hypothetical protein Pla22_42490 [Rubripirellula amarantea]|uniref:Uncharacterized protein n=1 Tax=Rubripirellula amarantea TaxID=2527999 RepID=A0A5C5WMZ3_9BACT|nr:hypothetical protein Pla22_42490 [Rubripirellula amarantea]